MLHEFVVLEGWRPGAGGHLLCEPHRDAFIAGVGAFVRTVAAERFPEERRVIVKEPAGSAAAPILSAATPESRMVVVVRDLRDVVASSVAGKVTGSWQNRDGTRWDDSDILELTADLTRRSVANMQGAIDAFDEHEGPKALVKYEALLANTTRSLTRIVRQRDYRPRPQWVESAVERFAFDKVPDSQRGEDKFFRKASPGSWREDLDAEQVGLVREEGQEIMDRFYAGWRDE